MTRMLLMLLMQVPVALPVDNTITVSGDAEMLVVPDRVRLSFGVETRDKALAAARAKNDADVKAVLRAARALGVEAGDIQTDFLRVELAYKPEDRTAVDYYLVEKTVAVTLKDVSRFEELLNAVLDAGANLIYDVEFSTTQLRRYRDEVRALARKAAQEKASAMASGVGLQLEEKPAGIANYWDGGGSSYGRFRNGGFMSQNVYQQAAGGGAPSGTVALGKIAVTASVSLTYRVQ